MVIFSEVPAHDVGALTVELVALGCMAVGLTQLSAHADLDLPTPV